ncbi:MAG TPA: hypothetical protein VI603_00215 [Saprospiraceae bacterium]|nr:hypothetical protein [Saprospiraceae bacterium]
MSRRCALCVLLPCLVQLACNVREPGCLDIEAENFDFEAERHDASLCIYPDLVLNVFYQWADSSLQTGYLYHNASGIDYAIHSIQILFSGFVVQNAEGEDLSIDERVTIMTGSCTSGTQHQVPDDFLFVDRSAFNYALGAFRGSGPMHLVRVSTGMPDDYTPMCLESLPASHLLRGVRAGYDEQLGDFALGRFIISKDSVNAVRDTFFAYGLTEELQFDLSRTFRQGRRDTIFMAIDFHQIFDPIDLSQDADSVANDIGSRISATVSVH